MAPRSAKRALIVGSFNPALDLFVQNVDHLGFGVFFGATYAVPRVLAS